MSPWKDKDRVLALIIGVILISAIILGAMAFIPLESFSRERDWNYSSTVPLESLDIAIEADVCDVHVTFSDLEDKWVEVSLNIEGRSGYISGVPDINFTVDQSLNGADLSVHIGLDMDTGPTVTYDESDLLLTIDRSVLSFLNIEVDVGDVVITVPENATLDGAMVHADVGGLHVNLEEGAIVGDLELRSDVGSVNLDSSNAIFADGTVVSAATGTGSVHMDVEQTSAPMGNITFECSADVGSVNLVLLIAGDVSAEVTSQANVGDINTDLVGFSGMDVHLLSDNHPDVWKIELYLEADVGSVYIDAEWGE